MWPEGKPGWEEWNRCSRRPLPLHSPGGFLTCEHGVRRGEHLFQALRGYPPQSDPGILTSYKKWLFVFAGLRFLGSHLGPALKPRHPASLPTARRWGSKGSQTRSITAAPFCSVGSAVSGRRPGFRSCGRYPHPTAISTRQGLPPCATNPRDTQGTPESEGVAVWRKLR